ncbi:MAG: PIN domain-containing protein [Candidatus Aenigmatarchaeota archaeon]
MREVITKERSMMILNELRNKTIEEIEVFEPYFKNRLLKITIKDEGYKVELSSKDEMKVPISREKYWDRKEIPGFNEYKECLISSGFVDFDNWDKFKDWIRYQYQSETDPGLSSEAVFLTIDTNIAYHRLISRRFPLRYEDMTIEAKDFDFILSSIVEGEIDHHIRYKYRREDIKLMGLHTEIDDIRYEFKNRGTLETRKAKFATEELNYLRGELNAARIKGRESKTDSEKNDIRIVESLENFAWDKNIDIGIISTDRNMANHAENSEISFFILETPHSIPKKKIVDAQGVLNLLHDLALMFGAVRIPVLSTVLFGIWGGKKDLDYSDESVKAWINPSSPIESSVKRDLSLINSLSMGQR